MKRYRLRLCAMWMSLILMIVNPIRVLAETGMTVTGPEIGAPSALLMEASTGTVI